MQKISFFILLICFSAPSYSLGKQGHQLVCQLTYQLLSAEQQANVDQLLASLPTKEKRRINKYNRLKANTDITLATACTWADAIKSESEYDQYKPWHYINVNRTQQNISAQTCQKDCVTQAIQFHTKQLTSSELSIEERAKALMFLGHWIGDIHQPLHVSFASDLGGNKLDIKPFVGKCKNLHWYWDQCLLYPATRQKQPLNEYWQAKLRQVLTREKMQQWQNSDLFQWANESLSLVRAPATNYCQLAGDSCNVPAEQPIVLSQSYHEKNQQILVERIAQASVRFAQTLNDNLTL
ncbi:S1/P1 nuclease [Thalassotalea marina]|uniref:S1/P1 nuclease n=1 Tax=Thalassotalea marina TaxID=1673741 RepID=A0A919BP38_9GAMM|nr:S1/P1 nuclease [Thalassotalea marina]GHG04041.1 hypothetical protein GCM10017161_36810 [Thalassotalea marina]